MYTKLIKSYTLFKVIKMSTKRFLYIFSLTMILIGIIAQPNVTILYSMQDLLIGKDGLVSDYFQKASIGAAFLNAGILGLIGTKLMSLSKADFNGTNLAAVGLFVGFGLFGKNIFNIWPIIFGSYVYAKVNRLKFKEVINATLYATCVAPLISEILFVFTTPNYINIPLALFVGISIGYITHIVAPQAKKFHDGFNLYNIGMTIGLISTVYVSTLRSFHFEITSHLVWDTNKHSILYLTFSILMIIMIGYGASKDDAINNYKKITHTTGKDADYIKQYGLNATFINMGVIGLYTLIVMYILNVPLNGPILGGIITVIAFGAAGKHYKNITPIYLAVIFGNIINTWSISNPSVAITMLFLTGLAPVAGTFGFIAGFIAAFINTGVALNTGVLHGGANLYNTGFSIGIVCAVIIPIYKHIFKHKLISNQ